MKARLVALAAFVTLLALLLVFFGGIPSVLAQRPVPTPPFSPRFPNLPTPVPNRNSGTRASKAVTAGPVLLPPNQGRFTFANTVEAFPLTIQNTGGADVFDITASSTWLLLAFKADGVTLLSDTNGNGSVDTGPVAGGATVTIVIKIIVPKGPTVGAFNIATVNVRSAATALTTSSLFELAIPAQFAQAFDYTADGGLSLQYALPSGTSVKKFGTVSGIPDPFYTAIAATPSGGFVYAWSVNRLVGPSNNILVSDVEYTIIDRNKSALAPMKLTNNGGAPYQVQDLLPAVAVAPNGRIGILWWDEQKPNSTTYTDRIWLAVLDAGGNVLQQIKIAETVSATGGVLGNPQIAATDDSRFVLAWQQLNALTAYDVWYQVRNADGSVVVANNYPLTSVNSAGGGYDWLHSVTTIPDNSALITWWCLWHLCEAAVASNGTVYQSADIQATLNDSTSSSVRFQGDAVTTSDGRVVIVWVDYADSSYNGQDQLAYVVLDRNSLSPVGNVTPLTNFQAPYGNNYVSAAADHGGRAIFTWTDCYALSVCGGAPLARNLYYAAVTSAGTLVTPPVIFQASASAPIYTSITGYGNAPYNPFLVYFPLSPR